MRTAGPRGNDMTESRLKRRWFRFSLRTLLIVVTVVGVWLGIVVNHARGRREAIRAVDELGGTYGVRILGPKWLRDWVGGERYFYDAVRVACGTGNQGYQPNHPFKNEDLARMIHHLKAFSHLTQLHLTNTNITDNGLHALKDLPDLTDLYLDHTQVSDRGIAVLEHIKTLRRINLEETPQVTDEGVVRLQQSLPKCTITH